MYEAAPLEDPESLLGEELAERIALACALHGRRWPEASGDSDLNRAEGVANDLFGVLDERFERYVEEERSRNEDRATIQERNLERHVSRQRETIQRTIDSFKATGRTRLVPATEGRLRTLGERYERRKLEIDARRQVTDNREEICIALVQVES